MTVPDYGIFVRDRTLAIKSKVDGFERLELNMRYNRLGSWRLELDFNSAAAQAFLSAFSEKDGSNNPLNAGISGILVMRNGQTLFSGPIRYLREKWSKDGHILELGGPDDLTFVSERIVLPSPYDYATSYTVADLSVSGSAENCIKQIVTTQLGSSAPARRQLPPTISVLANQSRGYPSSSVKARFTNALTECQRVATHSESQGYPLGFYLRQNGNILEFDCYVPTDKSASVIFSPDLGNVLQYEYTQEAPTADHVVAGNSSTGTNRQFSAAADGPSEKLYGTIEGFVDAGTASSTDLVSEVYKGLEEGSEATGFSFQPIELPGFQFQTDWNVGYKVKFRLRGNDLIDIIREVQITLTPNEGETIIPVIGTHKYGRFRIFDQVYNINYRLRNKENY